MARWMRILIVVPVTAAVISGAGACVDLFHSTDYATLCDLDAAACATADGGASEADAGSPEGDGGVSPNFCTNSSSEAKKLAETTCARLGSCLVSGEQYGYGVCYLDALFAYDCTFNPDLRPRGASAARWDCLSKATTCGAIDQCLFAGTRPSCAPFDSGGSYAQCTDDGSTLVFCSGTASAASIVPCPLGKQVCSEIDTSTAVCAGPRKDCTTTASAGCRGTALYRCSTLNGRTSDHGVDCAEIGDGRCIDDRGKLTVCAPGSDAPECTAAPSPAGVSCNGNAAEICIRGKRIRVDCGELGLPCDPLTAAANVFDSTFFACRREKDAGEGCTYVEDRCDRSVLESCRIGRQFTVDCSKVPGMKTCAVAPNGWATCSP